METKFKIGDRVRFRGTKHPDRPNDFVSLCIDGPDVFEAIIDYNIMGVAWGLRWDNGKPVGVPVHDCQLELVEIVVDT